MKDADVRFHEQWLGLAQPVEGLVFSVPALADAQITPKIRSGITAELEAHLESAQHGPALRDVRQFFETFLGYGRPGMLIDRNALPKELSFYAQEGRQEIRPTFAIARGPFETPDDDPFARFERADAEPSSGTEGAEAKKPASPHVAVVWDLSTDAGPAGVGLDLDKPEADTGPWRYPPTAKLERFLRHTGIPIGFISNRRALRVIYAPTGESSAHLTFRFEQIAELRTAPDGEVKVQVKAAARPLVAALELIFHAERTYGAASEFTFEGLLRESRLRQADVTKDLAAQVFEAVEILLEGFEHAAARDCVGDRPDWLRAALEERDDHFYQGILSVVLRLVFILYAEDQSLVPVQHRTYAKHLSVLDLYERLADDAGAHPESMHLRFGAYGRLVALFRAVFLGVTHGELRLPPRRGKLFDPSAYPFLEGGLPNWTAAISLPEERAAVQLPSIDDNTVYRVLHRLVVFKGQRLSYRSLDVEQIGAVYESLMGYHVLRVTTPAVRLGSERVWVETEAVRAMKPTDRKRLWKEYCGLSTSGQEKAEAAVKESADTAALAEALAELAPGGKAEKPRHRVASGRLVLQPGEERRRTGSHYTPRWLSEKVVKRTLEPILACLGEERTAEQILSLKICDPAMGSGAFLVAACRLLAEEVVAAWDRAGVTASLTEKHGDALLHARRLVAQRCLYGVDKNAAAVELAKLSLWLVTLSKELPFTFVDHSLRHGDSLVGLDLEQIRSFHWEPKEQLETCRKALDDALEQALEHRDAILALADKEDAVSQREKQRLLEYAEQAMARVRVIADLCVGAFFAENTPGAREKERDRRLNLARHFLQGNDTVGDEIEELAVNVRKSLAPFHWKIEFPEVFYQERPDPLRDGAVTGTADIDVFIGNPPFASRETVSRTLGTVYVFWLVGLHNCHGATDVSAHFFRRAAGLLGSDGAIGFVATHAVAEGVSRDGGLRVLLRDGFRIYDATSKFKWPGAASVDVVVVNLAKGRPAHAASVRLDGIPLPTIGAGLEPGTERPDPAPLTSNARIGAKGMQTGGEGFILRREERDRLVRANPKNAERIFQFIGGADLNSSPTQSSDRFVINFGPVDLKTAEQWPDLLEIVRARVKPERDRMRSDHAPGQKMKKYWWQFYSETPVSRTETSDMSRALVTAHVSKHLAFVFQPVGGRLQSKTVYVFALQANTAFAVMQSRVHTPWAHLHSATRGDGIQYNVNAAFCTFPFPQPDPRTTIDRLEVVGEQLYETRSGYMVDTDQGLTKTYNALKDARKIDPRIIELRRLHEKMDRAVLDAYGWTDITVPPFCPSTDAERAALQEFEDEVIDRLYVLNADRAREEERLGLGGKKADKKDKGGKKTAGKGKKAPPDEQEELF